MIFLGKKFPSETMAKIPKKLQKTPPSEKKGDSKDDPKAGVASTIRAHDYRFKDENAIRGLGLDEKSQKQVKRAKKLTSMGR